MKTFIQDESGAITVDWVVLAAGLVAVSIATMAVVSSGVEAGATDVDEALSTQIIQTSFATGETPLAPYAPFSQQTFGFGFDEYSSQTDQAMLDQLHANNMNAAVDWISNRSHSDAQIALDWMHGGAKGAEQAGYATSAVTVNGIEYDNDALHDLYDARFPS
jgi:Flp pilus assembly pilin Flp